MISLLSHEQRDQVTRSTKNFTCRGPRQAGDPTTEHGDRFLRTGVWADFDERSVTRTWVAVVDGAIGGYIALAADAVTLTQRERRDAELEGVQLSRYGCTQIVMLAVHADLHGTNVGTALVDHAALVGRESGERLGARFLAADVNPRAQGFYEGAGFVGLAGENEALRRKREQGLTPMVRDLRPRA